MTNTTSLPLFSVLLVSTLFMSATTSHAATNDVATKGIGKTQSTVLEKSIEDKGPPPVGLLSNKVTSRITIAKPQVVTLPKQAEVYSKPSYSATNVKVSNVNTSANTQMLTDCNARLVKVKYNVATHKYLSPSKSDAKSSKDSIVDSYPLNIYRNRNHVIYEYPEKGLSDVWQLDSNKQVELMRYFHEPKWAVAYTNTDLKSLGNTNSWYKLFSVIDVTNEKPFMTKGEGCETLSGYADDNKQMAYYDQLQLPETMIFYDSDAKGYQTYTFKSLEYSDDVQAKLTEYESYYPIRFADIERYKSEPFISKMMQMGYIESKK